VVDLRQVVGRNHRQFLAILRKSVRGEYECWPWQGFVAKDGYGRWAGKQAHRVVFELEHGPIPAGLVLDHVCLSKDCVNYNHLESVPSALNIKRVHDHTAHDEEEVWRHWRTWYADQEEYDG